MRCKVCATTFGAVILLCGGIAPAQPEPTSDSGVLDDEPSTAVQCKLPSDELRARLDEMRTRLLEEVVAIDELDDGYRLWFERSSDRLRELAAFVDSESQCCPFFDFAIFLRGEADVVALTLTGPDEAKKMLEAMAESAGFDLRMVSGAP